MENAGYFVRLTELFEAEGMFNFLMEKGKQYDPRNWEYLWEGAPARWILKFLSLAMASSVDSTCLNRRTGACLVDIKLQQNGSLAPFSVSSCFNGAPTGIKNCLERGRCFYKELAFEEFGKKYNLPEENLPKELIEEFKEFKKSFFQFCLACHAEANAIYFAFQPTVGKILFTTTDPCPECAKLIVQKGIAAVIYSVPYKTDEHGPRLADQSRRLFQEAKIPCINVQVPEEYLSWIFANLKQAGQAIPDCRFD